MYFVVDCRSIVETLLAQDRALEDGRYERKCELVSRMMMMRRRDLMKSSLSTRSSTLKTSVVNRCER